MLHTCHDSRLALFRSHPFLQQAPFPLSFSGLDDKNGFELKVDINRKESRFWSEPILESNNCDFILEQDVLSDDLIVVFNFHLAETSEVGG